MADNLLLPVSLDRLVDSDGNPVAGGKVFVYDAGTTNAKDVFTDNALTVAAANPIIADGGGYIEPRYVGTGDYKLVITDANDVTIKTADNLTGALATAAFENDEATPITPVVVKSANYTVQVGDKGQVIHADATGANITITLLSAATAGDNFRVTVKHIGSANEVTVATSGGDTLDGASSFLLDGQNESITCVSDGANWSIVGDAQIFTAPLPTGVVLPFAGASVPSGWLLCDGSAISRTGNSALFAVIGTAYGAGDGSTTFNLPDMGGRVPAGKEATATRLTSGGGGVDGGTLGAAGGGETHTLVTGELPAHSHGVTDNGHSHAVDYNTGDNASGVGINRVQSVGVGGSNSGDTDSATTGITINNEGGDGAHANVQPTLILNYIIKAT